ncbi:type IV fimbrial biogenesis protein PilW [Candidatus Kuenenia stuttgartiensis]|nr:prepilin-type N-terminal cleavage/methylation domain-containing protein [Candidatus Kuenenia stuttgartiensis]QII13900.1 type IV fimbrial biogenesis protein PilW [Candidatus Kuenenia stuttgartiensis]
MMLYLFKNKKDGFTLIELIISLAIFLILAIVAIRMFLVQRKVFTIQEQVSEMHQNVRSAMDLVSREVRMAGYLVGTTSVITNSGTNTITFLSDIDSDIVVTLNTNPANAGDSQISVNLSDSNDTVALTDYIYISDSEGSSTDFILAGNPAYSVSGEPDTIYLSAPLTNSYTDLGSTTVRTVEVVTFGHDTNNLKIERNSQPAAENIEILSFTYDTDATSGATNTVNLVITGRTAVKDPYYTGDGYRRATMTSTIKIRNQ